MFLLSLKTIVYGQVSERRFDKVDHLLLISGDALPKLVAKKNVFFHVFIVAIRSMFIQTASTPNPQSIKFIPGRVILEQKYGSGMVREGSTCVVVSVPT